MRIKSSLIGRSATFTGYNGRMYFATITQITRQPRAGTTIRVRYLVPGTGYVLAGLDLDSARDRLAINFSRWEEQ